MVPEEVLRTVAQLSESLIGDPKHEAAPKDQLTVIDPVEPDDQAPTCTK
jgi:hypothetical protein